LGRSSRKAAIREYVPVQTGETDAGTKAIIEAQVLERKVRSARNDLIMTSVIGAFLAFTLAALRAGPEAYALLFALIIAADWVPRTVLFTGRTEHYFPVMYPIYKARLKALRKALLSEDSEYSGRPGNEPRQVSGEQ